MLEVSQDKFGIITKKNKEKKVGKLLVAGTLITLCLFSGSTKVYADYSKDYVDLPKVVSKSIVSGEKVQLFDSLISIDMSQFSNSEDGFYSNYVYLSDIEKYTGEVNLDFTESYVFDTDMNYVNNFKFASKINGNLNIVDDSYKYAIESIKSKDRIDHLAINIFSYSDINMESLCNDIKLITDKFETEVNYKLFLTSEEDLNNYFEFIKYFKEINKINFNLSVFVNNQELFDKLAFSDNINSLNISFNDIYHFDLKDDYFANLKNIPKSTQINLKLNDYNINYNVENLNKYNLNNNLNLIYKINDNYTFDLDRGIRKLEKIKSITIEGNKYSIPVYFDNELIAKLRNNGIEVIFSDEINANEVKEINRELDEIISSLDVYKSSSDDVKLNKIIEYILRRYDYNQNIYNNDGTTNEDKSSKMYADGYLDAVFNNKRKIICGNYAALFESLANRLNLNSSLVRSETHAWNLVKIEDEYYYVDTCWFDDNDYYKIYLLQNNMTEELDSTFWYRYKVEDYINSDIMDETHNAIAFPNIEIEIDTTNYEFTNIPTSAVDLTNTNANVQINNKNYIVPVEVLLGILLGSGFAYDVTKSVKKKENNLGR